jgi:hypothetical protein
MYEYELEALPELESEFEWEGEFEGEPESEEFFGRLANLARQGWGWLTTPGSTQRRVALGAAQGALRSGLPAAGGAIGTAIAPGVGTVIGSTVGGALGTGLSTLLPEREYQGEFEWEFEGELNPIRRVYSDALMEHLGHAAATARGEAEAEAFIGALVPLAARLIPRAAPTIMRAAPSLIRAATGATQVLRRHPTFRPLVRTMPTVVRRTAASIAQQAAQGRPVTPQTAVRTLAQHTARVMSSPRQSVQAYQRSCALDRQYHRAAGANMGAPAVAN